MSQYSGYLLSTSFKVNDSLAWSNDPGVAMMREQIANSSVGFLVEEDGLWKFGWEVEDASSSIFLMTDEADSANDDYEVEETDILEIVQRHIAPGEICKIVRSGNEKMAIVGGAVYWVTQHGVARFDSEITCWHPYVIRETMDNLVSEADSFSAAVRALCDAAASESEPRER